MTRIQANGIELGYEIAGDSGDWVVLIHGLGYGRWGWTWQVPALAQHFRVVTFDNRGIGESDAPVGPYTAALMASDTAALMDALGIERAHVAGTSLGGFIAQELALAHPDRVGRLVLACTAFGGPRMLPMPEATVRLMAEAPTVPDEVRLRKAVENGFTPAFIEERPDVIERVMAFRRQTAQPYERWVDQAAAGAAFDAGERAASISAETLVITGTSDNVVDAKNSQLLADELPHAHLVEMAGGHLFFIERASEFNETATTFLKEGVIPPR